MTYKRIFPAIAVLATVLAFAFIACGDDKSTEDATAQLCTDLADLGTATRTLSEINETNTFDELEAAQDDVDQAVDDVRASAENVSEARIDEVEAARANLDETVSGIEGSETIGDAQSEVSSAASGILAALDQLNQSLSCPGTGSSPSRSSPSPSASRSPSPSSPSPSATR